MRRFEELEEGENGTCQYDVVRRDQDVTRHTQNHRVSSQEHFSAKIKQERMSVRFTFL
jgi:hypothetical protein